MKIATATGDLKQLFQEEEYFARLSEIGYEALDYAIFPAYDTPDSVYSEGRDAWVKKFSKTASIAKNCGLQVGQTHATFSTNYDHEKYLSEKCLDQFKREIETTAILNCPYIVIHPINLAVNQKDYEENLKINIDAFSRLEPTLREFNVKLGVEDMFTWDRQRSRHTRTGCSTPEDMVYLIDTLNSSLSSDRFVACLDTGHMLIHSITPDSAVRTLGERTKLLHLHDNYGISDNHNIPGFGITDWHALAKALKDVKYDGTFSLEVSFDPASRIDKDLVWDNLTYAYKVSKKIVNEITG